LHAITAQGIRRSPFPQVTVPERAPPPAQVQAGCCTFLLCPPTRIFASGQRPATQPQVPAPQFQRTVLLLCYRNRMAVRKKRSISLPPDLDAEIAAAAEQAGMSYSSWLAATARKEFTIRAGLAAVAQFEDEHSAFTPAELAEADQWAAQAADRSGRTGTGTGTGERRSA
jgi:hypothetical protein